MTSSSDIELRRCRPLLGTLVEISATGTEESLLRQAVDAAFHSIATLQRLLSVHDAASELSEVNRSAHRRAVRVSRPTFAVLERGLAVAADSGGAFDFTHGATLARWGLLPEHLRRRDAGDWRDVTLLPGRRVSTRRPVAIDLGGIAKGFAVDCGIQVLRDHGVRSGLVNAGGDLRAFGAGSTTVHLRHPAIPHGLVHSIQLHDAALATSSPCFTRRQWRGRTISHLATPDRHTAITSRISVSVRARECWVADALTKVVLNAPERAGRLLARHQAEAFVLTA